MYRYILSGVLMLAVHTYAYIDEDPGLYAEEFSIQAEKLGETLDDIGAVLEEAVAGADIDDEKPDLFVYRDESDRVYDYLAAWEDIPDKYVLCFAGLKESAIKSGETVDILLDYAEGRDPITAAKAAAKYEEAIAAYSRALDTYPYLDGGDR